MVSTVISCPSCKKQASLTETSHSIMNFGKVYISTIACRSCGFKLSDVLPAEFHSPKKFSVTIEKASDLSTKIVRSSSSTIEIPELGVKIEPGPISEGFITNIEGVLRRVRDVTSAIKEKSKEKQVKNFLAKLENAVNAKFPYTVILWDPFGNSGILGRNVREKKLSKKEIESLKKGIFVLDL